MPPNLNFEFSYRNEPTVSVGVYSPFTNRQLSLEALIDTGAEVTMLDMAIARRLRIDLTHAPRVGILGVGGRVEGLLAEVELRLANIADLTTNIEVAFIAGNEDLGNLIGLDVLSRFDFGLSHAERRGYFGKSMLTRR